MNNQIFLVLIFICSLSFSQSLQTPTPLSPGILSPGIGSVDSGKITFIWKSVEDADGYAFILGEFDGKDGYNMIYNSKSGGNIADTTYTPDNNIFKNNVIYRWIVQAKRGNEWSVYSERFYFKIKKVIDVAQDSNTVPDAPVLVFPTRNYFLDLHMNPTDILFIWKSVPNAKGYSLHLSKRKKDNEYETIFNSVTEELIKDTTYFLRNISIYPEEDYRWTIRAYGPAGWGEYSEFNSIINSHSDLPITPYSISPGNNSLEEESTVNLPVVLNWNKIYDAVEYAVNVSEKQNNGKYRLIYNSQQDKTVTDTVFSIPIGILKHGSSYKWNVRAASSKGWNGYSSSKYFRIELEETDIKPNPIQPGVLTERSGSSINSLTPDFMWDRVEGASFYNIIISRKSIDGSYSEIYNNESVTDNEFQIPGNVLREGKNYKWNVRAFIDKQWTEFSKDLYFSALLESDLNITSQEEMLANPEEVYLRIKYAGVLDGMVSSIFYQDKVFLPVAEVFTALEINNVVDYDSSVVTGNFIMKEIPYTMDFKKNSVVVGDTVYSFTAEEVIKTEFDYYLSTELYKEFFGINFELDFSNLSIKTFSDVDLPILSRTIRETNYLFVEGLKESGRPEINFGRERSMFNFGLFDYQLTYSIYKDYKPSGVYSFALGGELLGGDINVGTRGIYLGSDFQNTDTDYMWRYVFEKEKYITSVSGGQLNTDQGLENFNYNGVRVTNEPVEPRRGYGTYRIFDVTSPNWTVELYISNQLVGIARADAAGNFHFDIPLSYGTTLVQLKYYGPGGEFYTAEKLYQTPFMLLKPDEFNYALNLGEIKFTNQRIANLYGGYGFTDWLTNKTGIEYVEHSNGDTPVFYNSTTARFDGKYLLNMSLAPNAYYRLSANVLYYDQTSIDISYTNFQNSGFYNLSDLKHEFTGNVFTPIRFDKFQLNIQGNLKYNQSDYFESYESLIGVGAIWSGFNPFVNYKYSAFYFPNQTTSRTIIDAGFSWSIFKLPTFLLFMKGNIVSARTYYRTDDNRFESYSISFSTNILSNARIQISHNNNFLNNNSQTQLQLIVYFPQTQYSLQMSNDTFSQSLLGSIGYDHNDESLNFFPRHQIGRSAVSFKMFVDENGNDKYDSGEEIIKNAQVAMGTSVYQVNKDGIVSAYELNPYTHYTVRIVEESIKNPLLLPKHKVFSIVTDPNNSKTIEIPFYVAGEISGYLYRQVGGMRSILSGVKLHIVHIESLEDDFKTQVSSFYNGSFYYFGLKPGKYKVYIDPDQLKALNVFSTPTEMIIDVKADPYGDYVEDLIFVVE